MSADPQPEQEAQPLNTKDEVLFRQVHPNLLDGDEPASSAFIPTDADDGQLSVDRSALTTAQESHALYVTNGRPSGGVFGVTVGEFAAHALSAYPDPLLAQGALKANPAHALVDYGSLGTNQRRKVGKLLKTVAVARGVLHKP